jgi:hypothetical protein
MPPAASTKAGPCWKSCMMSPPGRTAVPLGIQQHAGPRSQPEHRRRDHQPGQCRGRHHRRRCVLPDRIPLPGRPRRPGGRCGQGRRAWLTSHPPAIRAPMPRGSPTPVVPVARSTGEPMMCSRSRSAAPAVSSCSGPNPTKASAAPWANSADFAVDITDTTGTTTFLDDRQPFGHGRPPRVRRYLRTRRQHRRPRAAPQRQHKRGRAVVRLRRHRHRGPG